jgi:hypothetical protein
MPSNKYSFPSMISDATVLNCAALEGLSFISCKNLSIRGELANSRRLN